MNSWIILLLGLVAMAAADERPTYYSAPESAESVESYESSEAQYNFQWAVRDEYSGNDFGHAEARDGDNTQGSYYVQLPDGRLQKVTFYVDGDDGYQAEVSYEGEAEFPSAESGSYESREAPSYAPPRPYYDSNESK